jgi:hypothetical protein
VNSAYSVVARYRFAAREHYRLLLGRRQPLERAAPAALVRRTRAVVDERVLDTANTVAAGGLLIAAGALLSPGAAVAGFLLGYLAITVVVVTLLQLVL